MLSMGGRGLDEKVRGRLEEPVAALGSDRRQIRGRGSWAWRRPTNWLMHLKALQEKPLRLGHGYPYLN
jgi:hypothetical protein